MQQTKPPSLARRQDNAIRAMFQARKQVFVDLLGWDIPVLDGRHELDQYDDDNAEYLILTDVLGRHRASARLLMTEQAHILGTHFPMLCAHTIPQGPTIREVTRFCLDRNQRALERVSARNQLVTALAEYALCQGITGYTGVADPKWFAQIMAFGWRCRALGPVVEVRGDALVALYIEIGDDTVDGLRRNGIYETPRLDLVQPQLATEGFAA